MLSDQEKQKRKFDRLLSKAREYTTGTYKNKFVAPLFQRMIRAEAAALPDGVTPVVMDGKIVNGFRRRGECRCVTCGKRGPWSDGLGGMHTGHFLASRSNSIIFEESNVACQCSHCNRYQSGAPQAFRKWMLEVRGLKVIERLELLKPTAVSFSREDLVDRRMDYQERLKAAEEIMAGH